MLFLGDAWRYWYEIDTVSHKLFKESFLLQKFFEKMESKDVASTKTRKTDIFESVWLRGLQHTAESSSAVSNTPRSQLHQNSQKTPRCATHRGVWLRGSQHTAELSSAVCTTPRSQAPRFATHRGVKLRGLQHTAESKCTPRSQNRNLWESLVAFKGTIRKNPFRGKLFYHVRQDLKKKILNC